MFCKLRLIKREKMWLPNNKGSPANRRGNGTGVVAIAIDKDKGSQYAIKWATDNLVNRGQTLVLIHVVTKPTSSSYGNCGGVHVVDGNLSAHGQNLEKQTKELFLTFHCFCTRKDIRCLDVILEDSDVTKALTEYVSSAAIQNLVLGASRHGFIRRLKVTDIPSTVSKGAPDFCTVYVISKSKISSVKNASRPAPMASPLYKQIQQLEEQVNSGGITPTARTRAIHAGSVVDRSQRRSFISDESKKIGSPFDRRGILPSRIFSDLSEADTDLSFVSSGRPSTDHTSSMLYHDGMDSGRISQISTSSDSSFGSERLGARGSELSSFNDFSSSSFETDDGEAEMRRLKMELQRTMDLYSTACKEALTAKQKSEELNVWRMEEEKRLEEARLAEEAAKLAAEKERDKCKVAMETAEAAQRLAELEAKRRVDAEMQALKEAEQKEKALMNFSQGDFRYRRYSIEEIEEATHFFTDSLKIGEGGYGPVYKCYLDHTPVAIKILRPDAAQGRSQFQQEVEVLSRMRHPNMVLLLGACPEYGCLVYEYMANGSLEERLMRCGDKRSLSWQLRFRIAAEIATGLLFLHQTKPEPLVHRDLKPGNILVDHNYVSKISDVGLSRLVPPSTTEEVTQYRITSAAGTFCYIDPEYQQTGMLGVKSDVYSLGILLLQLVTAKPAMGITHYVSQCIETGEFKEVLDPSVPDWPIEEALTFAKLALQCAELRRKDRPDLGKVVLPELNRLRALTEENMGQLLIGGSAGPSPSHSQASISQEISSEPQVHSGFSSKSVSNSSASQEKHSGTFNFVLVQGKEKC
ncbi:U-box domain-containing protein 52-like isoform X2 [Nicotiana tomentosiformis]|uniref:U-box domain-containing protein 52-like isoform X2 n=1 Tax=Nicotiana tomentosiformis TaxID=4098 RepID=UPI00051C3387|nr:U-box domain-containing protein 52-like isoform X2 [Nicotiana tomentosiformis]